MFSLYLIISHNKLLKKSKSIDEDAIIKSFLGVIEKRGGFVSEFGSYLSLFPSKYEYSRVNILKCLQELYHLLNNSPDLVGFSLIVDNVQPSSDFEYIEKLNKLYFNTNRVNQIWFTDDSYKQLSHLIEGKKYKNLFMVKNSFFKLEIQEEDINTTIIDAGFQAKMSLIEDPVVYLNCNLDVNQYRNIVYWAKKNSIEKILYIDFGSSCDKILTFIDYLMTLKDVFDPNNDLTDDEINLWGISLDLYNKFGSRSYDCFILDDALMHFNKLILLWIESLAKRNSILFVIKIDDDDEDMTQLWQILSILHNVKLLIFNKNLPLEFATFTLPDLSGLEICLGVSIREYLECKNDEFLMVLYIVLLTQGSILTNDILKILKNMNYNILILKEEINNYIRDGLLIGENNLYPGCDSILDIIIDFKSPLIDEWKNNFLSSFLDLKYDKIFSYSYIFSLVGLKSNYKKEALDVLYYFIQKVLDLGLHTKLSLDFIDESFNDESLRNILEYKKVRESRLKGLITDIKFLKVSKENKTYETSLEFIDILNVWSTNRDANLIKRCKELYYNYQTKSEPFNESRAKIIFALSLLSIGSVGESVDYFELNCSYSKNISDTYSYIRNGCFLSMALFVKGDISGVLRISESFLNHSWIYFKTRWLLYLKFIRARAFNELGDYVSALELLESGVILAKNFNYTDILTVYNNWKGRILYYLKREGEAREVLLTNIQNSECFYFLAEIEYFSGNIPKALDYIDKADFDVDDTVIFDEKLKWRDGFFLIEEFFDRSRQVSVLKKEITNFHFLLKILDGNSDALEEYKDKILKISNSSIGIYDYKYLYYLYLVIGNIDEELEINRENIFNKIIRLLQQRASHMAEHNQKHFYLNNFFNSLILEESKRKKVF